MTEKEIKAFRRFWQTCTYAEQSLMYALAGIHRPPPTPLPTLKADKVCDAPYDVAGNVVVFGDNADVLPKMPDESFDFAYIDPPYNTGNAKLGYKDARSKKEWLDVIYLACLAALPKMKPGAVTAVSCDVKNAHWIYSALLHVYAPENFLASLPRKTSTGANDTKTGMARTHDVLLLFANDATKTRFNEKLDTLEFVHHRYMNSAGTKETKGWFADFLYPKPVALAEKLISVFCPPDGKVIDYFAGSGTTGHAVLKLNRETWARRTFVMILLDEPGAVAACKTRMRKATAAYGGQVTYVE